jgi:hypothetical protein
MGKPWVGAKPETYLDGCVRGFLACELSEIYSRFSLFTETSIS